VFSLSHCVIAKGSVVLFLGRNDGVETRDEFHAEILET
jgi:hypothetical protein